LAHQLASLRSQGETLQRNLSEHERRVKVLQDQERTASAKAIETHAAGERMQGILLGIEERMGRIDEELQLIEQEGGAQQQEVLRLVDEEERCRLRLLALEAEAAQVEGGLRLSEEQRSAQAKYQEVLQQELKQLGGQLEVTRARYEDARRAFEFLRSQESDLLAQIASLTAERKNALGQVDQRLNELEVLAGEKQRARELFLERSVFVEQLKQDREALILERTGTMEQHQVVHRQVEEVKQKLHELHLRQMELHYQKNAISEEVAHRYQVDLTTLDPMDYPLAPEELAGLARELEGLREKLRASGTVNLLAIDEYQELKERFDFLTSQKNDLTGARQSILETIRKINRTTKKLFDDTLVRVREAFQEYFRILFEGGQADLILLDDLNPLDSGLDIMAKPPGKRLQHMNLLSGGEKALTAIALLFALFSVRPSPFCVLDEVDAPLDEANTDRFLNVLKRFLTTTQFVIITHSRKTIAMGDCLYGVTMEEPGVSKIVSVRLTSDRSVDHENAELKSELNQALT